MGYFLGKGSLAQLVGVHPELGFMCSEAIKITKQDFTVHDGIRTTEQQKRMVATGASKTMDSLHLYGLAVDLVPFINGAPRWEEEPLRHIITACKQVIRTHGLKIDNGYDLWGWDKWHWQMTDHKSEYDIRKLKHELGGTSKSSPAEPEVTAADLENLANAFIQIIKNIRSS